jgi:hypothetical protein
MCPATRQWESAVTALSRRMVLASGGAVLTSLLVGCGRGRGVGAVGDGAGVPTSSPEPGWGVDPAVPDAWRDFPVRRAPRPILLCGQPLRETGYHSEDAKLAVATGRFELAAILPVRQPATVRVKLPDGEFPLPIIPATQAYEGVRGTGKPGNAPDANPTPLRITRVELGTAPFDTDRGRLDLPAWLFHAPQSFEPLAWPAPSPEAFWRLGGLNYPSMDAQLAAGGVNLTVTMAAPYPGACPGDPIYRHIPVVVESGTAVAVGVRREVVSIEPGPRRTDCAYDAMLRTQPYTIALAAPLGNRVLVAASGEPASVTTA